VPSDPQFNARKRDRLPKPDRLQTAQPHLAHTYTNYEASPALSTALHEDTGVRFARLEHDAAEFPRAAAVAVTNFIELLADSRNVARF
ncbi:hypothetical protein ACFLTC_03185, partial [Chloroflexota bacterium]